jgi:hypothetical protein
VVKVVKCSVCGAKLNREDACYGDKGTFYEGKPLCEVCYWEDEPCATVYYGDASYAPLGEDDCPHQISYTRNETDGEFTVKWVPTDPWRGYYEAESKVYTRLYDDCILSGSFDAEELKRFNDELEKILRKLGIRYARVIASSSNVFSQGYEIWVHKEDLNGEKSFALGVALNILKLRFRDPVRFKVTALTGKTNPADFKEADFLLAEAFDKLVAGENPEKVQREIAKKLAR